MAKGAEMLNWIDTLPDDLHAAVMSKMKTVRVKEGALICERFAPAKGLFRVVSGTVRMFSLAPDGREMIYKLNSAGESFGDIAAIDGGPYAVSTEAVTDCELLFLSRAQLNELRKEYPTLETTLLSFVARIARTSIMSLEVATIFPLHARVASRLVFLATNENTRPGQTIELKIAQKDLSIMVGASRQAVNKILVEFQSMALIETHYGSLCITDLDGLRRQTLRFSSAPPQMD